MPGAGPKTVAEIARAWSLAGQSVQRVADCSYATDSSRTRTTRPPVRQPRPAHVQRAARRSGASRTLSTPGRPPSAKISEQAISRPPAGSSAPRHDGGRNGRHSATRDVGSARMSAPPQDRGWTWPPRHRGAPNPDPLRHGTPPGKERPAQEYLAARLRGTGLDLTMTGEKRERPNLVARLRGHPPGPSLGLITHIDVIGIPAGVSRARGHSIRSASRGGTGRHQRRKRRPRFSAQLNASSMRTADGSRSISSALPAACQRASSPRFDRSSPPRSPMPSATTRSNCYRECAHCLKPGRHPTLSTSTSTSTSSRRSTGSDL
jgi:hypothetical protein